MITTAYILMFFSLCSAILYADDFRRQYAPFACLIFFGASVGLFLYAQWIEYNKPETKPQDCIEVIRYAHEMGTLVAIDDKAYRLYLVEYNGE